MSRETWKPYDGGRSIGQKDSEGAKILRDEVHPLGGRITVKQGKKHISVSCTLAGWMDHTRFFQKIPEALYAYEQMKPELANVLRHLARPHVTDIEAWEAISGFVLRFP